MFCLMPFFFLSYESSLLYDLLFLVAFGLPFLDLLFCGTLSTSFPSYSVFHKKNLIREFFCIEGIGDSSQRSARVLFLRSIACMK